MNLTSTTEPKLAILFLLYLHTGEALDIPDPSGMYYVVWY